MECVTEKMYKHKVLFAVLASALFISLGAVSVQNAGVMESGAAGIVVSALIAVVIAGALLPTIFNQTTTLAENEEVDDTSEVIIGLWPLLVVIGVALAIIGIAL